MRLKHFVIILSLIYALVICGGFIFYRLGIIYPQLVANTLEIHKKDIQSIGKAFSVEQEHLRTLVDDWAKWDDSYEFIQDLNGAYKESNLVSSTFSDASLHGIYYLNKDKSLLFGLEKDSNLSGVMPALSSSSHVRTLSTLAMPSDEQSKCGFVQVHEDLELYCMASVQDSNQLKVSLGYLVFSRVLDKDALASIQAITKNQFQILNSLPSVVYKISELNQISNVSQFYDVGIEGEGGGIEFGIRVAYSKNSLPKYIDQLTIYILLVLLLVPIIIFYVISYLVVSPLANMSEYITALKSQEKLPVIQSNNFIHEVSIFRNAVSELMQHVQNERVSLEQKSLTDSLTGIKNKRAFDEQMYVLWNTAPRLSKPVVIILADIDYFKKYNDSLGHVKGDQAIQAIALALRSACRRSSDQIYRYGGEEFAITLVLERVEDLSLIMESIQKSVSLLYYPHPSSEISSTMTVSMGACLIPSPGSWMQNVPFKSAIEIADKALYKAKDAGRNTYVIDRLLESTKL